MTTVEEKYTKKNLREHIYSLPDTYIGSISSDEKELWIYNSKDDIMEKKTINYNGGLYKIFDEIIVNARDEVIRNKKTCDTIKVNINESTGEISVWNNGDGIPIVKHKEHKVYIPEMIFGQLLTSNNYDQKGKIVGGKNGYGAKLTNIFSKLFIVKTGNKDGNLYEQTFKNNMTETQEPVITKTNNKKGFVEITYQADFKKFNMKKLSSDLIALFKKRVYDLAAISIGVKVYLNDELIKFKSFEDYIKLYYNNGDIIYESIGERWNIGFIYIKDNNFNQISFVNGINTFNGGTHVDYILKQINDHIISIIKSKHKLTIKPSQIKDNVVLFINCTIEDPSFSSQSKDILTTKSSDFGSQCVLPQTFLGKITKSGIVDYLVSLAKFKEIDSLKKTDGKKTKNINIPKLDDAIYAGTNKSKDCVLILTEGDSAKSFAMEGLDVIGKEFFGVFPLKGKPINVQTVTVNQLKTNEEFMNIKKIMGLKQGDNTIANLRYGGILILSDQDYDGVHIKGLIINMLCTYWSDIIKNNPNFIQTMNTPLIKIFKKTDKNKEKPIIFYNSQTYNEWVEKEDMSKYTKPKYYKGLGTSDPREMKEAFTDFQKKIINFYWDNNKTPQSIQLAFDKKCADDRKEWLLKSDPNICLLYDNKKITIDDFINKDLIHFSIYDNKRSLPSICDGLKPSQRKILYAGFKRNSNEEMKVAQFAAYIAQHTEYHHGEVSLQSAIVNMAQNYPTSNNINLLKPCGQFGSRRMGGHDAASARYIFTHLNKITHKLFRSEDNDILKTQFEEENEIEPYFFLPILPTILINGAKGIGTGFSTNIYSYNPLDIVKNMKNLINGKKMVDIDPWFRGFKGKIEKISDVKYEISGIYKLNNNTVYVTEIPISETIENYVEYLKKHISEKKDDDNIIEYIENRSNNNNVDITIYFKNDCLQKLIKSNELEKFLKIKTTISLSNFYLFNIDNKIVKYNDIYDIMKEFYTFRLNYYKIRKEHIINVYKNELDILKYKIKFIKDFLDEKIKIYKQKIDAVYQQLEDLKYPKLSNNYRDNNKSYSYTDMSIYTLTDEKLSELEKKYKNKKEQFDTYEKLTVQEIWLGEIDEFEKEYPNFIKDTDYILNISNNSKKKK